MTDLAIHFAGDTVADTTAPEAAPTPVTATMSAAPAPAPAAAAPPASPALTPPSANTAAASPASLPEFEKAKVSKTEIKISGACAVNTRDETMVSLDDRLRICGEFRVVKVNHYVDKNGDVVRQQVIAPIDDLDLVPWNPMDPNDNGIVSARP